MAVLSILVEHKFKASHCHRVPPDGAVAALHSHDWLIRVRVEGPEHPVYGWVMDLAALMELVQIETDYEDLRDVVSNPTAERVARTIAERISIAVAPAKCSCVELRERPGMWAIWRAS